MTKCWGAGLQGKLPRTLWARRRPKIGTALSVTALKTRCFPLTGPLPSHKSAIWYINITKKLEWGLWLRLLGWPLREYVSTPSWTRGMSPTRLCCSYRSCGKRGHYKQWASQERPAESPHLGHNPACAQHSGLKGLLWWVHTFYILETTRNRSGKIQNDHSEQTEGNFCSAFLEYPTSLDSTLVPAMDLVLAQ